MKTFEHIDRFENPYSFESRTAKYPRGLFDQFKGLFQPRPSNAPSPNFGSFTPQRSAPAQPFNSGGAQLGGSFNATTSRSPSGGGGGTTTTTSGTQGSQDFSQFEESAPGAPSIDFDALIAPALESLNVAEGAAQSQTEADISDIEGQGAGREAQAAKAEKEQTQSLGRTQTRQEARSESAIGEQRRGFSEIQKGLAARFGGGISTGIGATGIAGAQALRNIGSVRTNLQEAINDINLARQSVKETAQEQIQAAQAQVIKLTQRARADLQSSLATIAAKRGELQSRKLELVNQALQNHQQIVADVNARNTAFRQEVFLAQQKADSALATAVARGQGTVDKIKTQFFTDPITGQVQQVGQVNETTGEVSNVSDQFSGTTIGGFGQGEEEDPETTALTAGGGQIVGQ